MSCSRYLWFLCSVVITFTFTLAQEPLPLLYEDCVKDKGNYTTNSTYQENLNQVLTSIYTNTKIDYGFYNSSYGKNSDKAYAIALCRPDVSPDMCRACVRNGSSALTTTCPTYKEAIGGYDNCILRYSNRSIFNRVEGGPYFWVYSVINVTDPDGFNKSLIPLLDTLRDQAASSSDSRYKYAVGNTSSTNGVTIYAMVQCTPDLSKQGCSDCLTETIGLIPQCCMGRQGGRVITPSCNFRYEIGLFYNSTLTTPPNLSPTTPPALSPSTPSPSSPTTSPALSPHSEPIAPPPAEQPPSAQQPGTIPGGAPPPSSAIKAGKPNDITGMLVAAIFLLLPNMN